MNTTNTNTNQKNTNINPNTSNTTNLTLLTTLHINDRDCPKIVSQKILSNEQLQNAIKRCLTIEMSTLFGLFYSPLSKKLTVRNVEGDKKENKTESKSKSESKKESKHESKRESKTDTKPDPNKHIQTHIQITVEYLSQMFIFQDFDTWFKQKSSKLQDTWKNWSGEISYADLYFVGRYQDPDLQQLSDLNMSVDIQIFPSQIFPSQILIPGQVKQNTQKQNSTNISKQNSQKQNLTAKPIKQISLKERKINFISQTSQEEKIISPHFILKSYTIDQTNEHPKFNLHLLTEKNALWLDNLIRLDINFQLPVSKLMYQSFNLLHFLEHCLLAFDQKDIQRLNIKSPNGATHAYGGMCLTVILPIEHLEAFKDLFLRRQKTLYSKLEADRIVQEMYQVGNYQSCLLGGLGFLHNNDLLKTSFDWNKILYDLYSQLDVVDSFVQISCNCDLDVTKITQVLKTVKQITTIPSPREKHIQKYFQDLGKYNTLPIFKYDTLIRIKKSVLKIEHISYIEFILAQDKQYVYMDRQQFEDMNMQLQQIQNKSKEESSENNNSLDTSLDTTDIFNPFQRFFDFSLLQQMWIQINSDTIEQMQYQCSLKNQTQE